MWYLKTSFILFGIILSYFALGGPDITIANGWDNEDGDVEKFEDEDWSLDKLIATFIVCAIPVFRLTSLLSVLIKKKDES